MRTVLFALVFSLACSNARASDCATARANASSASELIAKAEGAGFKLTASNKAKIAACFKKPKRKHHHD